MDKTNIISWKNIKTAYISHLQARVGVHIGQMRFNALKQYLDMLEGLLPPVHEGIWTRMDIEGTVLNILRRPISSSTGHRYSVETTENLLQSFKSLCQWLIDNDYMQEPKAFLKLFRHSKGKLKTNKEKHEDIKTFFFADLRSAYSKATADERLWMLLGLNCGFTSAEISVLLKEELKEVDSKLMLNHWRNKTGSKVFTSFTLWDETTEALRSRPSNDSELLLTTNQGKALLRIDVARIDTVANSWRRLQKRTGLQLSHKYLRKTGATWIAAHYGKDVAQQYLQHTAGSVAEKHYISQDFTKLGEALEVLRKELFDKDI